MKPIKGFEKYKVAENGDIFSDYIKGRKIKSHPDRHGYLKVRLWIEETKKYKNFFVHRIVAETYLENNKNKKTVNHKNGIKIDNRVCNLEWATNSENELHSYRKLGKRPFNIREVEIVETGEKFDCIKEASYAVVTYPANICRSIRTGIKCKGYTFRYVR